MSGCLEQAGRSLTTANAHGDDAELRVAPRHLIRERANHARTGHAKRMPDRNRAAVHVELLRIDAEAVAAVDHLNGKGFVELPQVNVVHLEPLALEKLRHRKYRADAHLIGLATGDGKTAEH